MATGVPDMDPTIPPPAMPDAAIMMNAVLGTELAFTRNPETEILLRLPATTNVNVAVFPDITAPDAGIEPFAVTWRSACPELTIPF